MEHSLLVPRCAQTEGNKRKKALLPGPATQHGITRSWCSGAPGAEPCGLCWHVGAGTQLRVPWAVPCLQQSPAGPRVPRPSSSGVLGGGGASLGAEAVPLPGALPCRPRRRRTRASAGAAFIIGLAPRQTPGRMRRGAAQRRHLPSFPPSLPPPLCLGLRGAEHPAAAGRMRPKGRLVAASSAPAACVTLKANGESMAASRGARRAALREGGALCPPLLMATEPRALVSPRPCHPVSLLPRVCVTPCPCHPMFLLPPCPCHPMSLLPHVLVSPHPWHPVSLSPHIPVSPHPYCLMSLSPHALVTPYPFVPISLLPHILVTPCPCHPISL